MHTAKADSSKQCCIHQIGAWNGAVGVALPYSYGFLARTFTQKVYKFRPNETHAASA
jgi:hypothetical protein